MTLFILNKNPFLEKILDKKIGGGKVADAYLHGGDKAICKYLIATWKYGNELGHAIGLNDEQILTVKNAVKENYMPQEKGHSAHTGSGRNI